VIVLVPVIVEVDVGLDVRVVDIVVRAVLEAVAEPEADTVAKPVVEVVAEPEGDAVAEGDGAKLQQNVSSVSDRGPRKQPQPEPCKLQSPAPFTISKFGKTTSQMAAAWT